MTSKSIHHVAADMMQTLHEKFVSNHDLVGNLLYRRTQGRTWTRGDGARMRDPSYFVVLDNDQWLRGRARDKSINFKFHKSDDPAKVILDAVWDVIKSLPGSVDMGYISGEFGSSTFSPALKYKGTLFVKRNRRIEYTSPSILRNKSVWRHRPPTKE